MTTESTEPIFPDGLYRVEHGGDRGSRDYAYGRDIRVNGPVVTLSGWLVPDTVESGPDEAGDTYSSVYYERREGVKVAALGKITPLASGGLLIGREFAVIEAEGMRQGANSLRWSQKWDAENKPGRFWWGSK